MALEDNKDQENSGSGAWSAKNTGNGVSPLFGLLGQTNLISSTHNITEVSEIRKLLEDTVKDYRKNTASESQKLSLPSSIKSITSDISPQLPGIALSISLNGICYVMPVLFYKSGVTEATDTIFIANENMPRGIAKTASSFMNKELMNKVQTAYKYVDGKEMNQVYIVSPTVLNLESYIKNSVNQEEVIKNVSLVIFKEWNTGLYNLVCLDACKAGMTFPNPFKEGKMFGKDDSAIARIESVNRLIMDGKATPFNLSIRLTTTNKNNSQNYNSNNSRSICTSYVNVSLESMSPPQFMQQRQARPGQNVGPLVPVISVGNTIPGETLNNNNSILTVLLGLYASIGANTREFFSEAFRGKEVGNRGNLGNFNHYIASMMGGAYSTRDYITDKNITNAMDVNRWINTYVAPNAVYVLDLPTFTEDASNSDFWWNIVGREKGSVYHRTLIMLMDSLTGGRFSELVEENGRKGAARDPRKEWVLGDPIIRPTSVLLPSGIAMGKDGKWFDLSEVDGMFLRQETYYGQNENAVNEYLALIYGGQVSDVKVRQFNIYNKLMSMFSNNVIIDGWKSRFVFLDSYFNTFAASMTRSGTLSLSSPAMAAMWTVQYSNSYLDSVISTNIQQQPNAGVNNVGGAFTNY